MIERSSAGSPFGLMTAGGLTLRGGVQAGVETPAPLPSTTGARLPDTAAEPQLTPAGQGEAGTTVAGTAGTTVAGGGATYTGRIALRV